MNDPKKERSSGAATEVRGRREPGASGGESGVHGSAPDAPEGSPLGRASGPACQWRQGGPCTAELEGGRGGQECRWRRQARAGMDGAAEGPLERELRRALGPVGAPAGLEEKILAAVRSRGRGGAAGRTRARRVWRVAVPAVAAGLALAALVPGYLSYRHRRTEEARAQLVFALRLTSKKLNMALERTNHKARTPATPPAQGAQETKGETT